MTFNLLRCVQLELCLGRPPVLQSQAWNPLELSDVVGDQNGARAKRMRGDHQVYVADGLPDTFELGTDHCVLMRGLDGPAPMAFRFSG